MARCRRIVLPGGVHHVLNRGNRKATILFDRQDYQHFIRLMVEGQAKQSVSIVAFALMRNHWHLVVRPDSRLNLSAYMQRLQSKHACHIRKRYGSVGHLYQGRFKCFPVQSDISLLQVLRYVEANAVRAGVVKRAEDWPWCSLTDHSDAGLFLAPPPVPRAPGWLDILNEPDTEVQLEALRTAVERGTPFGSPGWVQRTIAREGMESTVRRKGRPMEWCKKVDGLEESQEWD